MTGDPPAPEAAVLDPVDRSSEVLFGLIMALTFTTTFEVATAGRADVRAMLIGALGCNLAWGLVDGVMFVVTRSVERHRFHSRIRAVQAAAPNDAARILESELPDGWDRLLDQADLERLAERARTLSSSAPAGLRGEDCAAASRSSCWSSSLPFPSLSPSCSSRTSSSPPGSRTPSGS